MLKPSLRLVAVALAGLVATAGAATAQDYPEKPIKVIVPFSAGGGTDITTRLWADLMAERLGERILVENMGGAAGSIGTKAGIAADPDGYNLLMGVASTMAINPHAMPDIDYNPETDVEPVAMLAFSPWLMAASAKLPVDSVEELIQYDKDHPGELTFAGWTGTGEIGRKVFKLRSGVDLLPVPYPSSVAAMTDLIAGRASIALIDISAARPHVEAGDIKVLAMTSSQRTPLLPDVPSMSEAGVDNYEVTSWVALFAPVGTPKEIIDQLNKETVEAMNDPETTQKLLELGLQPLPWTPEETKAFVAKEGEKWKAMIEETKE